MANSRDNLPPPKPFQARAMRVVDKLLINIMFLGQIAVLQRYN